MNQWGFFFNQDRCVGCKTCTVACKNWNEERRGDAKMKDMATAMANFTTPANGYGDYIAPVGGIEPNVYTNAKGTNNLAVSRQFYMKENWRRVEHIEDGNVTVNTDGTFEMNADRRYLSISCNHCSKPACLTACPMSNITKTPDTGIVLVGKGCIACGKCKQACPWGAPQFYDENYGSYEPYEDTRPRMTKCNMCIDRIVEGRKPACVAACWNRALDAGPIDELKQKYQAKGWTVTDMLNPDFVNLSCKPNILFKVKQKF